MDERLSAYFRALRALREAERALGEVMDSGALMEALEAALRERGPAALSAADRRELPALLLTLHGGRGPAPVGLLLALLGDEDADVAAHAALTLSEMMPEEAPGLVRPLRADARALTAPVGSARTLGALIDVLVSGTGGALKALTGAADTPLAEPPRLEGTSLA